MSTKLIEQELADLKKRVKQLEAKAEGKSRDGWKEIFGWAKGGKLHREAQRLGAEWRAKENKKK